MKIAALIFLTAATSLCAVETASKGGFAPPKKYGTERYEMEWNRNPFSVPTPPTAPVAAVSAFKDMAIAAIYGQKDDPTVQLVNLVTKKRTRLSLDKPNEGISLKSFSIMPKRKDTTVEVTLGTETATLHFDETYIQGAAGGQARQPLAYGAPGMPRIPVPAGMQSLSGGVTYPAATNNRNIPQVTGRQGTPTQNIPNNGTATSTITIGTVTSKVPSTPISNAPRVYGAPATSGGQIGSAVTITDGTATTANTGSLTITTGTIAPPIPGTTAPGAAVTPGVSNRRRTLISVPPTQ